MRGTRNLPFSADIILELMGQMSWECYHMGLEEITDSAFADVKKYTLACPAARCSLTLSTYTASLTTTQS